MKIKAILATLAVYASALALLAVVYNSALEEAVTLGNQHLNRATALQESQVIVDPRARAELGNAIAEFDKVLFFDHDNLDILSNRAGARFKLGIFDGAVQDLDRCIALAPADWYHYYLRASAYENLGNFDAAGRDYQAALQTANRDINPGSLQIVNRSYENFLRKTRMASAAVNGLNLASYR